jgi:hypothetical protein
MLRNAILALVVATALPAGAFGAEDVPLPPLLRAKIKAHEAHPLGPKPSEASKKDAVCGPLEADYEKASKLLALNAAEDVADNSAIRSASRHAEDQATLEKARITMDLMAGNKCKMPTAAPSAARYLSPALQCATDQYRAVSNSYLTGQLSAPASCDTTSWTPSEP